MSGIFVRAHAARVTSALDPRFRILQEHFFSLRPAPLEEWLWDQSVPPSAERVFWLHWREGQRQGDFCSEIPLSVVARRCRLNVSSVTRAYQVLERLGCLKRTDPGRNPANPFCQATAVTEVFIPQTLLATLSRQPRRACGNKSGLNAQAKAPAAAAQAQLPEAMKANASPHSNDLDPPGLTSSSGALSAPTHTAVRKDPLAGLSGRQRVSTMAHWRGAMSAQERSQYDVAFRESRPSMTFDPDSRLSADERIQISELLNYLAARSTPHPRSRAGDHAFDRQRRRSRELRMSEAAALRSNLIDIRGTAAANELLREIAWSTEKGALAKYPVPKAIAIGLKKVRENAWTRPNRMPPNWWPAVGSPSYAAAHGK